MTIIENIQQKASFLNNLSNNENALFEYINTNQSNLEEVIAQYKPEKEFKPVNTLRFLIANEIKNEKLVNKTVIDQLKQALENRDVSNYQEFNDAVLQSLADYKNSKTGMFPNWKHSFKILFPFIHNTSENDEVKTQLNQLADEIISFNQLENVTKHIVSFQGSNNYGKDRVWLAILPESSPSVQYAYQIFINIDKNGLIGGIHKGHNLTNQIFDNQNIRYDKWEEYLAHTKQIKEQWLQLNSEINFILLNDEKDFLKRIKKTDSVCLTKYFKTLDNLIQDLSIQDEENLVFSIKNKLSFQVGKRICLSLNKDKFGFITSNSHDVDGLPKENFNAPDNAYLYANASASQMTNHYNAIKEAVESEIERDNHTEPKSYDNSAFRKAAFDKKYRAKVLNKSGIQNKYYLVGAYWDSHNPQDQTERFVKEDMWENGYDNKFIDLVKKIPPASRIAIKTVDRKGNNMYIKAKGVVLSNNNDGQNLKVDWETNFKEFKVDFSGGYWDTITEVKKKEHIYLIWENNSRMNNVKQEFIDWYIANPRSSYFNNEPYKISDYLTKSQDNFSKDIFLVNSDTYREMIEFIEETINNNKVKFLKNHGAPDSGKLAAIVGKRNYQKFLKEYFNKKEGTNIEIRTEYKPLLNQIFYGPPGTGKTYKLQNEFFDNYTVQETSLNRSQYIENIVAELTWWQVLSIILLDLKKVKVDQITKHELLELKGKLSNSKSFRPTVWGRLQAHTKLECPNVNVTERSQPAIFYKDSESKWTVDEGVLEQYYPEAFTILEEVKNFKPSADKLIKNYEFVTFHQSFSYEDFIEGIKPKLGDEENEVSYEIQDGIFKKLCLKADADRDNDYAIFIDEINRGNVSAIFGELITLIEKDKRLGEENELSTKLPYSKKELGVPPNLYIFGTMNTADRSVEALDTALRRRFAFEEVMPKPELLADIYFDGFNLQELLRVMNERIETLLDRDHTIGHSYLMKIDSGDTEALQQAFENNVIPLLQEYFYHDYEKIALILGEGFVVHKESKIKFAAFKNLEDPELAPSFELKKIDNIELAIRILLNLKNEESE